MTLIGPSPEEQAKRSDGTAPRAPRSSVRQRLGALARLRVGLLDMPGLPFGPPPGRQGPPRRR